MHGEHINQKEEASRLAAMAYRSSVFVHEGQEAGGKQLIVKKKGKRKEFGKKKNCGALESLLGITISFQTGWLALDGFCSSASILWALHFGSASIISCWAPAGHLHGGTCCPQSWASPRTRAVLVLTPLPVALLQWLPEPALQTWPPVTQGLGRTPAQGACLLPHPPQLPGHPLWA